MAFRLCSGHDDSPDGQRRHCCRGPRRGRRRVELSRFRTPKAISAGPKNPPANTLGIGRIMFAVEDIDEVVARLQAHGATLVGEVAQYEDMYRLCYMRGP